MNDAGELEGWQDYAELKKMLVVLGDVVRLNIVRALARLGEVNVTDLAQLLLVSQPLVSWHLSRLRRVGLVRTRRQGRQVYCSLDLRHYERCLSMLANVVSVAPAAAGGERLSPAPGEGMPAVAGVTAGDAGQAAPLGDAPGAIGRAGRGLRRGAAALPGQGTADARASEAGAHGEQGDTQPPTERSDVATTAGRPQTQAPH